MANVAPLVYLHQCFRQRRDCRHPSLLTVYAVLCALEPAIGRSWYRTMSTTDCRE